MRALRTVKLDSAQDTLRVLHPFSRAISNMSKGFFLLSLAACSVTAPTITKAEYDALPDGASYAAAQQTIGTPGEEISSNAIGGTKTVMYAWKNADGSNANVMFQNDRLVTKAQFGLK